MAFIENSSVSSPLNTLENQPFFPLSGRGFTSHAGGIFSILPSRFWQLRLWANM
jgi:hypothetical protein